MENLIVLFLAPNAKVVVDDLIYLAAKSACHIEESRLVMLGNEMSGIMRITGSWNAIAKMEDVLHTLKTKSNWWLEVKRSPLLKLDSDHLPYVVQTVSMNKPAIMNELTHFFTGQEIQITDLQTDTFKTSYTDTKMLALVMRVQVPATINISDLRERFMVLCDELNVDGILEPEKGIK